MTTRIIDGNEAAVSIAYRVTELSSIYPITPSTSMGELADSWAAEKKTNIWGAVPQVIEMQSEGGASGTLHGALQAGALATTYTASQGLLLMIPNMYKIAGELTATVMHVASRSLAVQALSIFGDHSDVMAVRQTGWAMLASASVQEAHDLALIAHTVTLEARIPFVHFFDGFRVSHELNKIEYLEDEILKQMISNELVNAHRARALNPEQPFIRGTSQNPDVYFQGREAVNGFYKNVPALVSAAMEKFAGLTGRKYRLFDYYGAADAENIIVVMGSGAITAKAAMQHLLTQGEKVGVLVVRLFRPFSLEDFIAVIPKSVKNIAVLDRTKEPGSLGEPLYQDVVSALHQAQGIKPRIFGGRYGLGSKEFTPAMALAVFAECGKDSPTHGFTIGIKDDVTCLSLLYNHNFVLAEEAMNQAIFYGLGADGTVSANKNTIKIIGDATDFYTQGYFVYDSKKAGSQTISHLRFGKTPIAMPYLIQSANFIACHQFNFVKQFDVLKNAAEGAIFLLNSPYDETKVWQALPGCAQERMITHKIKFYVIDAYKVARKAGLGSRINTVMQVCHFALSKVIPLEQALTEIKKAIKKSYGAKGEEIVAKNFAAVDATLVSLKEVKVPEASAKDACNLALAVAAGAPEFVQNITARLLQNRGDYLPVSAMSIDGTYPSATAKWEKRNVSDFVAGWNPDLCIQCGQCALVCPHAVLRSKHYNKDILQGESVGFKSCPIKDKQLAADYPDGQGAFTLQVYLEDCTGCGLCNAVCPAKNKDNPSVKAIMLVAREPILEKERKNIKFFETIAWADRAKLDVLKTRDLQYLEPLFEFSGACAGCGETPYVRILSQLYGDRLLVANATGCSSIYGGNLPTTPWAVNADAKGPAWSNSLFEDNAEFGLGFRLAVDLQQQEALFLVNEFKDKIGVDLAESLQKGAILTDSAAIKLQRQNINILRDKLKQIKNPCARRLEVLADHLVQHSVWLLGGDGWAYDIGFGGLDHVLASGHKVKALVLDTEVYSNTGGQASKATPIGAVAKFAVSGKAGTRKDLGLMMMSYGNIYVAQIALGANQAQALKAFKEAEEFDGPSLVIAYSTCIAHGIVMNTGLNQQKLAVQSGFWPLYRYNPALIKQGLKPLQFDSPEPTVELKDFIYNEPRFKSLLADDSARAAMLLKMAEDEIKERRKKYLLLANEQ